MATGKAFVVNPDGKLDTQYNVYTQSDINIAANRGYDTSHITAVSEEAKAVYQASDSRALFGNSSSGGLGVTSGLNELLEEAASKNVASLTSDGVKVTANMGTGQTADVVFSYNNTTPTGNAGAGGRAPEGYSPSINQAGSNLQGLLNGVAGLPETVVSTATQVPAWVWFLGAAGVLLYLNRGRVSKAYANYQGRRSDIDLIVDKQWTTAVQRRANRTNKRADDRAPIVG